MGNWAELDDDLLRLIIDQYSEIKDIAQFGAVCQSWRSISVEKWHFCSVYPWLMLVEKEDSDNRDFYSLSTKKVYNLKLPEARGRKCWSSHGWLITLGLDLEIHLFNPFSGCRFPIRLPPQPTLPNQFSVYVSPEDIRMIFIKKVILSSKPTYGEGYDEKCVVMGIFSDYRKLAFLKLGDEVWTPVYTPEGTGINDVVYLNGQFYAIADRGKLVNVDISNPDPKTIEIAEPPEDYDDYDTCSSSYLVESEGELLLIARDVDMEYEGSMCNKLETLDFGVYKFNFDDKSWTKLTSLDNRTLFVGANASFAISPSNRHSGCEPNCIYFTDDHLYGNTKKTACQDMGLFRMETEKIDKHYDPDVLSFICEPIWICPCP